jgi:hypothetical protein
MLIHMLSVLELSVTSVVHFDGGALVAIVVWPVSVDLTSRLSILGAVLSKMF